MGFTTSGLWISPPALLSDRAALRFAGVRGAATPRVETVEHAFHPADRTAALVAFDGAKAVFAWTNLIALGDGAREARPAPGGPHAPLGRALGEASRGGEIAYLALHSIVQAYAILIWRDGRLVRALTGAGDQGRPRPDLNEGAEQPFETAALERMIDWKGRDLAFWRSVRDRAPAPLGEDEWTHDALGEPLVLGYLKARIGLDRSAGSDQEAFFGRPAAVYRTAPRRGADWWAADPPSGVIARLKSWFGA